MEALGNGDREAMSTVIDPLFEANTSLTGLAVLEIGDQNGIVFYRGHNPGKFGDDKSGLPTISGTLAGNEYAGAETGSSGLAIRAFAPVITSYSIHYTKLYEAGIKLSAAFNKEKIKNHWKQWLFIYAISFFCRNILLTAFCFLFQRGWLFHLLSQRHC